MVRASVDATRAAIAWVRRGIPAHFRVPLLIVALGGAHDAMPPNAVVFLGELDHVGREPLRDGEHLDRMGPGPLDGVDPVTEPDELCFDGSENRLPVGIQRLQALAEFSAVSVKTRSDNLVGAAFELVGEGGPGQVTINQIALIALADDLRLRTGGKQPRDFQLWDEQAAARADFAEFVHRLGGD